jgi:hypothetical protein
MEGAGGAEGPAAAAAAEGQAGAVRRQNPSDERELLRDGHLEAEEGRRQRRRQRGRVDDAEERHVEVSAQVEVDGAVGPDERRVQGIQDAMPIYEFGQSLQGMLTEKERLSTVDLLAPICVVMLDTYTRTHICTYARTHVHTYRHIYKSFLTLKSK